MKSTPDYNYLDKLNDQQRAAVEYLDGPELVIAGAGSGKTRVLTYKIVHLLNSGYRADNILALTFTNKAAREMKERIAAMTPPGVTARLSMGTFHSVFLRILRMHADKIGYSSNFSIYDATDSKNLVKMIIKDFNLPERDYKASAIAATISNAKNALLTPQEYEREYHTVDLKAHRPYTSMIFTEYQERCVRANAMDFDDIIMNMYVLLRDFDGIRKIYSEKFRYILVDEYQDTNFAQHQVIKKLAAPDNRLCVVGDDAQSIYSFRGANIGNILELEKSYPGLRTFRLERNYRSTQNIVNASDSLIKCNTRQLRKDVYSENAEGAPVEIAQTYSDLEEAALVASRIAELSMTCHDNYEEFVILYRTNAQSRVLEEALRKRSMPYRIYGGTAFYQRKEVKDAVAYFRAIVNPDDDEALRRIINYPARGIGDTTMKKIHVAANSAGCSLWKVISAPQEYDLAVNSGTLRKLDQFARTMNDFIADNARSNAYEVGQLVFNRTGILAMLASDRSPENISRQENLRELLAGMKEFVDGRLESGEGDVSLTAFLSEVMLATDQDATDNDNEAKVTMMTAHAAKGLEFKHVFIVGVEEELFPSSMSMDSISQVEEERRLLYVAMTRARETCMLSYARTRFRNGQTMMTSPSRFLREIDPRFVRTEAGADFHHKTPFANPVRNYRSNSQRLDELRGIRNQTDADSSKTTHSAGELAPGTRIEHSKFGIGTVVSLGNVSGQPSITVDFGVLGIKKLLLQFARFDILPDRQ